MECKIAGKRRPAFVLCVDCDEKNEKKKAEKRLTQILVKANLFYAESECLNGK